MKTSSLQITAFFDGRPGHEKQTKGIIHELRKHTEVEVVPVKIHYNPLEDLSNHLHIFFSGFLKKHQPKQQKGKILLGTGRRIHSYLLKLKYQEQIPAFTCMTPSFFLRSHFNLCFVPAHDNVPPKNNIFSTFGPPNCSVNSNIHKDNHALILIGGIDENSLIWDDKRVTEYVNQLIEESSHISWTISSSPRTPKSCVKILEHSFQNRANVTVIRFEDTKPGWIEKQYDLNKKVWVTGDSMSMIYEALTAGCTVGIIPVKWKKNAKKFILGEQTLLDENLVHSFHGRSLENQSNTTATFNEAERCAKAILKYMKN